MSSSRRLIDEEPLLLLPTVAARLGLNRAVFLQQLHYWLKKSKHAKDGRKWIYNTFKEWHEQFPFWTTEAIRKIVNQLKDKGIIVATDRYNERKGDRTLWYTINYEAFDALFEDEDESTQAPEQPEKSTQQPEKSTDLESEKSTQRYQRLPETNNRDSDLQSGESAASDDSPPPEEEGKPQDLKQYAVSELMDRVGAARARGAPIHDPLDSDRGQYARFFAARSKRHEIDILLFALDYLVARASGEIENEKKAWCGFDTALDRVLEGWRPGQRYRHLQPVRERREYDKYDRNPEVAAQTARLMEEAGMTHEWIRGAGLG